MAHDDNLKTRREFLGRGLALAAAATTVPSFVGRAATQLDDRAGRPAGQPDLDQSVLVVIQLAGGNDVLNTLVPYSDDAYYQARPELGIAAKDVLKLNDRLGLHPSCTALKSLYDDGELAIVNGVGYPNPDRSHFRSMEIWETASDSDKYERHGWIGRYFDNACKGSPDAAMSGLRVGRQMPQAFSNGSSIGISLQRPEQYRWLPSEGDDQEQAFRAINGRTVGANETLDFLQRTALNANLSSDRILSLTSRTKVTAEYPDSELAADLKIIAQMIAGGLPTRVYYASLGGFDTHAQQADTQANLLDTFGTSLQAFCRDLATHKVLERVTILAFSEFGRRVKENASGGTDHGSGGALFLAGGGIRPGVFGEQPSLTDLDRGDLKFHTDFRTVYATLLDGWLGCPSKAVLGQDFGKLAVLKA